MLCCNDKRFDARMRKMLVVIAISIASIEAFLLGQVSNCGPSAEHKNIGPTSVSGTTAPTRSSSPEISNWSGLVKEALALRDKNLNDLAANKYQEAIAAALSEHALVPAIARIYVELARTTSSDEETLKCFRSIIDLYANSSQPPDIVLADAHFEIGSVYELAGRSKDDKPADYNDSMAKARKEFATSVDLLQKSKGIKKTEIAWGFQKWAYREQDRKNFGEADKLFKQAQNLEDSERNNAGYSSSDLAFLRNYLLLGHYEEAIPLLERTLTNCLSSHPLPDKNSVDVTNLIFLADCANDIGQSLLSRHKFVEAEALLKKAVQIRQTLGALPEGKSYTRKNANIDTVVSMSALANCLLSLGRIEEAQKCMQNAIALKLPPAEPWDWERQEEVYATARRVNRAISVKSNLNTKSEQHKAETKNASGFYREQDFDRSSARYSPIEIGAALRLHRTSCWSTWDWHDTDTLLSMASRSGASFAEDDPRRTYFEIMRAQHPAAFEERLAHWKKHSRFWLQDAARLCGQIMRAIADGSAKLVGEDG